jgi:signal transduction histidine kinase
LVVDWHGASTPSGVPPLATLTALRFGTVEVMSRSPRLAAVGPWAADAVLAVFLALVSVAILGGLGGEGRFRDARVVAVAAALGHTLVLVARRRAPRLVLGASVGFGLVYAMTGLPLVGLGPAVVVPVYTVGSRCSRRDGLAGLAAAEAAVVVAQLLAAQPEQGSTWVANAVVLGAAWVLGEQARRRREAAMVHEDRARRLEAAEGELARRAVADERLRIARELHDVVAHSMSVIAVQAGTGRLVLDDEPEVAREALATIETTSRSALAEMRRLLGVLRSDDDPGVLGPMPGLGDVAELAAQTAQAGLRVEVRTEGETRQLPVGADLAAFRIVQEALTNVRKHAGANRAWVVLRYTSDQLVLEVRDDGTSPGGCAGGGHGLVGMRERAALYGGDLHASPLPGGGFGVIAHIPYQAAT